MNELLIKSDAIEICSESFGERVRPAILLIIGAQSSLIWWEEEFCQRLADTGRFVVRYDNRDVGRSTTYEPGQPDYTFEDMADDAIRVLDAYKINQAHIVGMSMGGMLTQMIALRHPDRVLTVTLLATSNFAPDLPPMEEKVMDYFSNMEAIDWTNEQSVVDFVVGRSKILVGSKHPFDENKVYQLAKEDWKRSNNMASMNNHAMLSGGESYLARTGEITIPALVIHGTEDPIIPYEHGMHLANEIPGAVLLTLEGAGHEIHYDDWDLIIDSVSKHTLIPN
ncbi:alpha/beta hydrolase [Paenibacillus polymyxa]|uniref:Hydrolase, alpha/beta fold family n=1 Tax=Paenibacillus polymyxa TaxID=1406 RepID=A0A378XYD5_PAEPO|nr:alpha/beta hydrolase [Paenibacillus polymyxa]MBE7899920.1 alpha/beta hydrolase [Paenibacillus polymyxa]MBG9764675.1 acetyltransferase [Paenibacillus polymyxa]MCC3259591.1 alpha/beta fold hydrolase [Paenibacillus polymyxa]QPK55357.1 alpha/beta hydrolase [Paenibacillus polymyxa]QPK60443.1 alpha/beta hydrolase [Paenibacillus polymyxa]